MSKEKKVTNTPVENNVVPTEVANSVSALSVPPTEKLSETDRLNLDLAKSKRQTALAEAKTALASNENAELQYKYLVLQIYMKYSLTAADAINENGDIIRGGALQQPQGQ